MNQGHLSPDPLPLIFHSLHLDYFHLLIPLLLMLSLSIPTSAT